MKSDFTDGRYYIECGCGETGHLLVFEIDPEFLKDYGYVGAYFATQRVKGFFERFKIAFRYLFKKKEYLVVSEDITINDKNLKALKQAVKEIEKLTKIKKLV